MSEKKVKLSSSMKEAIRHMRDGYRIKWESSPILVKKDCPSFKIRLTTVRDMYDKKLLHQPSSDHFLTELGKSIEL